MIIIINLGQTSKPYNKQKKRTCKIVDFAVPADHRVKLKESEKNYRTLHSYNLIWAVCHLSPQQRWWTHSYSVSGNHWPGEPRDLRKTTPARKFRPAFGATSKTRIFYKYVVFKHSSSFTQILRSGYTFSLQCDILLIHQQEWKATTWMGLADIHFFNIHWLWDFFQSQRNRPFPITKRKTFKYVILL